MTWSMAFVVMFGMLCLTILLVFLIVGIFARKQDQKEEPKS